MRLPFVSRRAYDLLLAQLDRVIAERDSYRERGDRVYDQTILRLGYEPSTPSIRAEYRADVAEYESSLALEDPFSGMLDEEIEREADAVIEAASATPPLPPVN